MFNIAEVIVDVPAMQTNKPFDYEIPMALATVVQPGMRVLVGFGKGDRTLQGFVINLKTLAKAPTGLKAIKDVVDLEPILSPELLDLSSWLAQTTYAFQITCLQTILPGVMRGDYEKIAYLVTPDAPEAAALFHDKKALTVDNQLTNAQLTTLVRLKNSGAVRFEYQVHNKARIKTRQAVILNKTAAQYTQQAATLPKKLQRQKALLQYLATQTAKTKVIFTKTLQADFSASVLKTAEKHDLITIEAVEVKRRVLPAQTEIQAKQVLLPDQAKAVAAIDAASTAEKQQVFLLEGVTGSGKTEVYLQTMANVLTHQRTALMLVPEIALTPQMVQRVYQRFGDQVAVLHSGLSEGEKYDEWRRIKAGEAKVVVGARSAVFAPLENIGLIIMDEEHESSYKQEDTPRYHARDVAIHRAAYYHCPVVLGSATPSLESRARAQKGVYQLLRLPKRVNQAPLPEVHIVDMRENIQQNRNLDFSRSLADAITLRLAKKEQSVLMLNRRGFSSFVMCRDCGYVVKCPNCDISLTLHVSSHSLKCHYCGHEEPIPKTCPNCQSRKIRYFGTGTEKIEQELQHMYPEAKIIRMDVDTTRRKGAYERLLKQFGQGDADILLGTQMIAKGLDFPNVTLVGVINADTALGLPDFRASERTFQLLTQVAGRAGRGDKKGEVFVQTYNPDHYAIQLAKRHDYEHFFATEMNIRHQGNYPPYYFTVQISCSHPEENQAAKAAYQMLKRLQPALSAKAIVLGPTPRAIARIKNRYYYQIIVKYKSEPKLAPLLADILQTTQRSFSKQLYIAIDREPLQFM
ncbi:primosomal protein N' [Agrilactobacillus yilanensis]|uniref:Replication restart protein PriA n=1 Tax=Agrilactobacillus yilanensis TaxID=2485997 RepID=A0ABW4J8X0_9LACO|nr:primosomal protein N' [Agrilactobacillus yilanensis]